MALVKDLLNLNSADAVNLNVSFVLFKGVNTGVDYEKPSITESEFGEGMYEFNWDPETVEDDIVFVVADDIKGYRIGGILKKERYRKVVQSNFVKNNNSQISAYREDVSELSPVSGDFNIIERHEVNLQYSGIDISEVTRIRTRDQ